MNLSIKENGGDFLVVSQFTLHASTKKGNRPSYIKAAKPDVAVPLYESFIKAAQKIFGDKIKTGRFAAERRQVHVGGLAGRGGERRGQEGGDGARCQ